MNYIALRSVKKAKISFTTLIYAAVNVCIAASLQQALSRRLMVVVEDSSSKDVYATFQAIERSFRASLSGRAPSCRETRISWFRTAENPCGTRPNGGHGRRSATRGPSSGRNCLRPYRAGKFAAETAWYSPPPCAPRDH